MFREMKLYESIVAKANIPISEFKLLILEMWMKMNHVST